MTPDPCNNGGFPVVGTTKLGRPIQTCDYATFLARKSQLGGEHGFEPLWMPDFLFDFQKSLVEWAVRKGRAAIFADCGLGKTPMQLVWAENVVRKTGGKVLIVAPLAVSAQTQREAVKFGMEIHVSRDGSLGPQITVTNYERLHYFNHADFIGAVADESSAIKAFNGKRRKQVVRFFSKLPYRLLCTATPSPNDFIELGTNSEALGVMTQSDMLGYFFRENENRRHTVFTDEKHQLAWVFKPHSEQPFWRWVASWSRALQKPSDLGFDDDRFVLPPLNVHHQVVDIPFIPRGELFPRPAISLREQREERQRTIPERCEKVASLVDHDRPAIVWCHYNAEGDYLEKLIPGSVQISGRHDIDQKESMLEDFAFGRVRVLVTKPKIGCWGLNLQHCGDMTFFPTHSYEGFYQGVRRCWRFGREGPVNVDIIASQGESRVIAGLEAKQEQATRMFASLVRHMNDALAMRTQDGHDQKVVLPGWLNSGNGVTIGECRSNESAERDSGSSILVNA